MKRVGLVLCVLLLAGVPAGAQTSRFEVSGAYAFMRDQDRAEDFPSGWVASVVGNITDWAGAVAEVGSSHRMCDDCQRGPFTSEEFRGTDRHLRVFTFMAGPRFASHAFSAVTPFAQFLMGGSHFSGGVQFDGALTTGFSYQPGGGVNLHLTPSLSVRLQGDYRIVRTQGHNTNASRFLAGIVWRQGELSGGGS
jgi:opacity protein-like surface antigen